jgi:hypothetical protein
MQQAIAREQMDRAGNADTWTPVASIGFAGEVSLADRPVATLKDVLRSPTNQPAWGRVVSNLADDMLAWGAAS